jgi:hypothetical protein
VLVTVTGKCVKAAMHFAEKFSMHRRVKNALSIFAAESKTALSHAVNAASFLAISYLEPEILV